MAVRWSAGAAFRQIGHSDSFAQRFDVRVQRRAEFSHDLRELVRILLGDRPLAELANLVFRSVAHQWDKGASRL